MAVTALAVAIGASLALVRPAEAMPGHPGCWYGGTYTVGNWRRVFPMPRGCVWLYFPVSYQDAGKPPEIRTRVNGVDHHYALPETNYSEGSNGLCKPPLLWWFMYPLGSVAAQENFGASGGGPFGTGCPQDTTKSLLWMVRVDPSGAVSQVWSHRGGGTPPPGGFNY